MEELQLLLTYIFDYPAQKEYFLRLNIYGIDEHGNTSLLALHSSSQLPNTTDQLYQFCDKVKIGETLEQAVKRSLIDEFGFTQIKEIKNTGEIETAYNKKEELLPRCVFDVLIPYQDLTKNTYKDLYVFWINLSNISDDKKIEIKENTLDREEIIAQLDKLAYFTYVHDDARTQAIELIRENLHEGMPEAFLFDTNDEFSLDRRIYYADEENLAEGGIGQVIKNMKDVLKQENVTFETIHDVTKEDGTYNLIIDGKAFEIFNHSNIDSTEQWTIAHKRILEIVNHLLIQAGSKERLYGQYNGNDGRVILLTEELFNYFHTLPLKKEWLPYKSEDLQI